MASTSAKYLRFTVNGVTISGVQKVEVREPIDALDATTADTNGYGSTDGGVQEVEVTVSGLHNLALSPWPVIRAGTLVTNVVIFSNVNNVVLGSAVPDWQIPNAIALEPAHTMEVRGQIQFSVRFKSRGAYTGPNLV